MTGYLAQLVGGILPAMLVAFVFMAGFAGTGLGSAEALHREQTAAVSSSATNGNLLFMVLPPEKHWIVSSMK